MLLEFRQYTLRPAARDTLIGLFEREFVETQEAEGMTLPAMFRDLDAPDRFVWLRGFTADRGTSLAAFYSGPTWRAHRDEANATMIDSDNVLLLEEVRGLDGHLRPRPPVDTPEPGTVIHATIHHFTDAVPDEAVAAAAPELLAVYRTAAVKNTFPALPVRENEHVVVTLDRRGTTAPLPGSHHVERLRLAPTGRSTLS